MVTEETRQKLLSRKVVLSLSGGKDSTACALYLQENGIPFESVHCDTGWEHTETMAYVRGPLNDRFGPIKILTATFPLTPEAEKAAKQVEKELGVQYSSMVRAILYKGMFSSRVRRFCTQELKVYPFRRYARELNDQGVRIINVVGIRHDESAARAQMPEWEPFDGDAEVWRPLIHWSVDDVIAIHKRHNMEPNPLYLRGASRVGCWPCIFARKSEIRMLAQIDPKRVEIIEKLEAIVGEMAKKRYSEEGLTLESLGYSAPAWFTNPKSEYREEIQEDGTVKKIRKGNLLLIREVVDWAFTKHGGKEFEPYAPQPGDGGCMRWGLCDMGWASQGQLFRR
jgi:3'-phosphoadenosine 5'-phosphosulfate sulfotransferase (PAPS reductase)/FAD synthetase